MSGFWVQITETRHKWFPSEEAYLKATNQEKIEVHNVIQDSMEPAWHPATGEIMDSKRNFARATKNAGCVEIAGADLNPGQREVNVAGTDYEIGKQIHDLMEAGHVDYRDLRKDIARFFRGEE